jgi:hypothetical protein
MNCVDITLDCPASAQVYLGTYSPQRSRCGNWCRALAGTAVAARLSK